MVEAEFCPDCQSLLLPKEEQWMCNDCGSSFDEDGLLEKRRQKKEEEVREEGRYRDEWPKAYLSKSMLNERERTELSDAKKTYPVGTVVRFSKSRGDIPNSKGRIIDHRYFKSRFQSVNCPSVLIEEEDSDEHHIRKLREVEKIPWKT